MAGAPRVALIVAVAAYAGGFAVLSALRHRAFETGRFDLGNMVQAVWSTAHGRPLEATSLQGEQFVRLGSHFDPILALFAPLWLAWPSPELLLVVQAVAVALGAVPLFWLTRKHSGSEWSALALALAYLLAPALQWMTMSDFHPVALATPLLLFAVWFLDERRWVAFAAVALLAVGTKEHVGLAFVGLGIWYAISRRRTRPGAAIAAAGAAVSALAVLVVIPHFSPLERSAFESRYDEPALERRDLRYVGELAAPTAGLGLAAPVLLVAALPELGLNVASETVTQTSIRYHYSAVALAALFAAAALGAGRLPRWAPWIATGASLVASVALGPLTQAAAGTFRVERHDRIAAETIRRIPEDAPVCATNGLGAHLSDRRRFFSFPFCGDAAWLAVDRAGPSFGDSLNERRFRRALRDALAGGRWVVVSSEDGVLVLRRARSAAGDTR